MAFVLMHMNIINHYCLFFFKFCPIQKLCFRETDQQTYGWTDLIDDIRSLDACELYFIFCYHFPYIDIVPILTFFRYKECFSDGPTDGRTNGRMDQQTDGRTDKPSYRDARTHLKKHIDSCGGYHDNLHIEACFGEFIGIHDPLKVDHKMTTIREF